jgi:hypothetical protein
MGMNYFQSLRVGANLRRHSTMVVKSGLQDIISETQRQKE